MARGNDSEAALSELADKFGQGVGNAESLIDGNLASQTQALRAAQLLPRDPELTAEARKNISKLKGPNGEKVVSVAVRGSVDSDARYTCIVYRTEEGRDLVAALDEKDKPVTAASEGRPGETDEQDSSATKSKNAS